MDDRLREIEERVAKASPGPWIIFGGWGPVKGTEFMGINRIGPRGDMYAGIVADHRYPPNADFYMTAEDAEFVAASREDIPYLLSALREAHRLLKVYLLVHSTRIAGGGHCPCSLCKRARTILEVSHE